MFSLLWRRLRNRKPGQLRGKCLQGGHYSSLPQLEPLEDRMVPALGAGTAPEFPAGGLLLGANAQAAHPQPASPVPGGITGLQPLGGKPAGAGSTMRVTVAANSPETVIDLGAVFSARSGIQHEDGLKLAVLGNTNSALVKTDLSEAALTLTYAGGKYGTATITVSATDADGVSVQETILITVSPPRPAGAGIARAPGT